LESRFRAVFVFGAELQNRLLLFYFLFYFNENIIIKKIT